MSEAAVSVGDTPASSGGGFLIARIAWRNVWRNRRRTWLTSGSIAFAIFMVSVMSCLQYGMYTDMRDLATRMLTGHAQVAHHLYPDSNRLEHALPDAAARLTTLQAAPGVHQVFPRVQGFALVSAGERSFAAQVIGMDFAAERDHTGVLQVFAEGRLPANGEEAIVGTALARNLSVGPGDELVVLGSSKFGGVAAMALTISGTVSTGVTDLDRALLLLDIGTVQESFELQDEVHALVVRGERPEEAAALADSLRPLLDEQAVVRPWQEIMPEVEEGIQVDAAGGIIMFAIVMLLVTFSVVNTFIMVIFERKREFGVLRALGMRPWSIIAMVQLEALLVWVLGLIIAALVSLPLMGYLVQIGIPLGEDLSEMASGMYMPTHLRGTFNEMSLFVGPLVMFFAVQVAAMIPSLRIRRLRPVEAIRSEA